MENTNEFDENMRRLNALAIELQGRLKSMQDMQAAADELYKYKQNPYPKDSDRLEAELNGYLAGRYATNSREIAAFVVDFLLRMDYPNKNLKSLRNWLLNDTTTNA